MPNNKYEKKSPQLFRQILLNSFIAALVGGILSFIFLSASPENALKFGEKNTSSLSGGISAVGFLGSIIWNFVISILGAFLLGFTTAIGSLIYHSFSKNHNIFYDEEPRSYPVGLFFDRLRARFTDADP